MFSFEEGLLEFLSNIFFLRAAVSRVRSTWELLPANSFLYDTQNSLPRLCKAVLSQMTLGQLALSQVTIYRSKDLAGTEIAKQS